EPESEQTVPQPLRVPVPEQETLQQPLQQPQQERQQPEQEQQQRREGAQLLLLLQEHSKNNSPQQQQQEQQQQPGQQQQQQQQQGRPRPELVDPPQQSQRSCLSKRRGPWTAETADAAFPVDDTPDPMGTLPRKRRTWCKPDFNFNLKKNNQNRTQLGAMETDSSGPGVEFTEFGDEYGQSSGSLPCAGSIMPVEPSESAGSSELVKSSTPMTSTLAASRATPIRSTP
ncbi:hypothetical protein BGZ80_008242, partial [Entomortierella chlamydospora]